MPMEEFIHQQNLERYRKILSEKTHEPQRQTILRLLATKKTETALLASSIALGVIPFDPKLCKF